MEPFDVMDVGRMAIVQDKEGAFLRLWYPLKHAGAGKMHEPGAIAWFELATTDTDSAGSFYAQVLGAEVAPDPDTPFDKLFKVSGVQGRYAQDW